MSTLIARDQEASYNQQHLLTAVDVAGFSKVFGSMWGGSLYGRFEASAVFMVLLSLCDKEGTVDMTPEAIAGHTGWPLELIRKGVAELAAPDPRSRTPDCEGRRILALDAHRDWGWRITNYQKYRDQMRSAERKEYLRQKKEEERLRKRSTTVNTVNTVNQCQPIAEAEAEAEANNTNTSGFALFWSEWPSGPRKTAKKQCEAKWRTQGCEPIHVQVRTAVGWLKANDWLKDGGAYIPAPLTWLNKRGWEFEAPKSQAESAVEAASEYLDEHAKHMAEVEEARKLRAAQEKHNQATITDMVSRIGRK